MELILEKIKNSLGRVCLKIGIFDQLELSLEEITTKLTKATSDGSDSNPSCIFSEGSSYCLMYKGTRGHFYPKRIISEERSIEEIKEEIRDRIISARDWVESVDQSEIEWGFWDFR